MVDPAPPIGVPGVRLSPTGRRLNADELGGADTLVWGQRIIGKFGFPRFLSPWYERGIATFSPVRRYRLSRPGILDRFRVRQNLVGAAVQVPYVYTVVVDGVDSLLVVSMHGNVLDASDLDPTHEIAVPAGGIVDIRVNRPVNATPPRNVLASLRFRGTMV